MNPQDKHSSKDATPGKDKDPAMQGEGNHTAARRHRESVEDFLDSGRQETAALEAAPKNDEDAREMKRAEKTGKSHARR